MQFNNVNHKQIHLVDATSTGSAQQSNQNPEIFKHLPKMDLVISCYAYGWHSRINKYIKEISEVINTGGLLVLDYKKTTIEHESDLKLITSFGFEHIDFINTMEGKWALIARKI